MLVLIAAGCSNEPAGTSAGVSGGTTATAHAKAVEFAECMRKNGVSAFPDPDASGSLTIDGVANGSRVDTANGTFEQAGDACKGLEPPGFTGGEVTPEQRKPRLAFAQCIRDNGVRDFPDPTTDGPLIDTNRIPSSATPGGMAILNAAMATCGTTYAGKLGLTAP